MGFRLIADDLVGLQLGQADIVEPVEHAVFAVGVDLELDRAAIRPLDFLLFQIDRQSRIGAALGVVEQFFEVFRRDADRQHAILEAVIVENIAERGRDHAADAEIHQRPGRVFPRGTAAEIVAGDQDLGFAIGRLVEDEIRVFGAVVEIALLGEQALGQPGTLDRLEILLGDDHVGVDIDDPQGGGDAFQMIELFHALLLSRQFLRMNI